MNIDPEVAKAKASHAVNTRWAKEPDRTAATAPGRQAFLDKLLREARENLGPQATEEQVIKAADSALKAHMAKMRLKARMAQLARQVEDADGAA